MRHCIIVKFDPSQCDKKALIGEIREFFATAPKPEVVRNLEIFENCVDRENRFDLMIVAEMEKSDLALWDSSSMHALWKEGFGKFLLSKTIFDYE